MDDRAKKEDNCFPSRQYSQNKHNFKGSTATRYGIPKEEETNYTTSQQRNGHPDLKVHADMWTFRLAHWD